MLGASGKVPMVEDLTKDDWDRIVHALSQFTHHADFRDTLDRVLAQLPLSG